MLKIYNTLAREKQEFKPREAGKVRMYVCGMTIYDYCHVGHGRMLIAFDIIQRWLRCSGYDVTYVRNITDIDDKIIKRAAERGVGIGSLTSEFIGYMEEDIGALGIQKPDIEPRATQFVPQMLDLIGRLKQKNLAYASPDGDVNFSVRDFPGYGKLSGKSLEQLRAGERVAVSSGKRDPLDFVMWKHAKPDEPAEARWDSAWGPGRPGWHIECSAMALSLLGEQFDIHGGGADLQFPHHENEIAQSEGATGRPFANYWLHNGFLNVDNEKMSKSLGNFFTIRAVLKHYDAEVIRFFLLRTQYRSPFNYSDQHIDDARSALTRLYVALRDVALDTQELDWNEAHAVRFRDAMNDDFNTPVALAALFDLANEVNKTKAPDLARQLRKLGGVLGLLQRDSLEFLQKSPDTGGLTDAVIEARIAERQEAKKTRDFPRADAIRAQLLEAGIVLEDSAQGTVWRRR
ncbi:MAG: cysteine--tRNA ligase [Burkholderiaceae bacterium]|jgi:cysteinyl-tRNA synthetase